MKQFSQIAYGADPEVFWVKDGHPQSVEGLIGGTKRQPLPMDGLPDGYYVQEDNVAAEYNIPPAKTADQFSVHVARGLRYIEKLAKQNKCHLAVVSAMYFPWEQLKTQQAQTLGCEPDYDAYTLERNPTPIAPIDWRSAAGHVHISWLDPEEDQRQAVGICCDAFLGVPSLLETPKTPRRELYGKAGAIRLKDYGVEYRVLDNFWITKKEYRKHLVDATQMMFARLNKYRELFVENLLEAEDEIKTCINTHDKDMALWLMGKFDIPPFPIIRT